MGSLSPKKSPIAEKKTLFPADLAEEPLLISGNLEHLVNLKEWFGPWENVSMSKVPTTY